MTAYQGTVGREAAAYPLLSPSFLLSGKRERERIANVSETVILGNPRERSNEKPPGRCVMRLATRTQDFPATKSRQSGSLTMRRAKIRWNLISVGERSADSRKVSIVNGGLERNEAKKIYQNEFE